MLLQDIQELRRLREARGRPNLSFLQFSLVETLSTVRATHFPEIACQVGIHFVDLGPLACVCRGGDQADIYLHQMLNHDQTPPEVVSMICKHELLHLRIPAGEKNGLVVQHPLEFWEAEKALCPERTRAWVWIWTNLEACLKRKPKQERIDVLPRWKKMWARPRTDIATCLEINGLTGRIIEDGGW